jgi:hypothetical protein
VRAGGRASHHLIPSHTTTPHHLTTPHTTSRHLPPPPHTTTSHNHPTPPHHHPTPPPHRTPPHRTLNRNVSRTCSTPKRGLVSRMAGRQAFARIDASVWRNGVWRLGFGVFRFALGVLLVQCHAASHGTILRCSFCEAVLMLQPRSGGYLVPCTLYLVPCTLYLVPCTLYLVPCTLYLVPCTLYLVPCALYLVPCALYLVRVREL